MKLREPLITISLLIVLVPYVYAQADSPAAQQTSSAGGGQSEEEPSANPGRPTITTPATLTPVGYLQFESGIIGAWRSPEFTARVGLTETVKLAVSDRLQLLAVTDPAARYTADGTLGAGLADYFLGFQGVLHAGEGANPTIAASYLRRVYDGPSPELDYGSPIDSVILLGSADALGFHIDTNFECNRMAQDAVHRAQFAQTLSVSHPLTHTLGADAEIWHFTQPYLHGEAVGSLGALTYTPRKNLVFDAGFDHGLTKTSTQWEAFAGVTYLLPHRLWRKHAAVQNR